MSREPVTLDEMLAADEPARLARLAAEDAEYDAPEAVARRAARRAAEFEKGVRLGWHDADGNAVEQPEGDGEDDSDEDEA